MSEKETRIDVESGHTARFMELSRHFSEIHKRAEKLEQEGFTLQNKRDALQVKLKAAIIDDAINNTNKSEALTMELYKLDAKIKITGEQHKLLARRRDDADFQAMMRSSAGVSDIARSVINENRAAIAELRARYETEKAELTTMKIAYLEKVHNIGRLVDYGEMLVEESRDALPYSGLAVQVDDFVANDIDHRHWRGSIYDGITPEVITETFKGPAAKSFRKTVGRDLPLLHLSSIQQGE